MTLGQNNTAEGLDAGGLVLSFNRAGSSGTASNTIGALSLTGTISNPSNLPDNSESDMDSLAFNGAGELFGANQFYPTSGTSRVFQIDRSGGTVTMLFDIFDTGMWDFAFAGANMFFINDGSDEPRTIAQYTTSGSLLGSATYSNSYALYGLANSANVVIPEPASTGVVLGLLALIGFLRGWKSKDWGR